MAPKPSAAEFPKVPPAAPRLQQLPGFDNKVFIDAQGSTEEALFTCWKRPA